MTPTKTDGKGLMNKKRKASAKADVFLERLHSQERQARALRQDYAGS
jgi:hypothetical protein